MPGTPHVNQAASGTSFTEYTYQSGPTSGDSILAVEIPAGSSARRAVLLETALEGGRSAVSGSVIERTDGTYQGYPSLDALLSARQGSTGYYVNFRLVASPNHLVAIEVDGLSNPPGGFSEVANSLTILKP